LKGPAFDPAAVEAFVATHRIEIVPFDREAAERVGEKLSETFVSNDDWNLAKWKRCAAAVGHRGKPPNDLRSPATVDWLIARHLTGADAVLVTEDQGIEFEGVRHSDANEALAIAALGAKSQ
jgi:hypothetical protein